MEKNFQNFSVQEAMKLANSDAGKQLMAMLQQQNGQNLRVAADQAAQGDFGQAKAMLENLMADPKARALLQQLGRNGHG